MFPIMESLGPAEKVKWDRVLQGLSDDEQMIIPAQVSSEGQVNTVKKCITKTGLSPLHRPPAVYLNLATVHEGIIL